MVRNKNKTHRPSSEDHRVFSASVGLSEVLENGMRFEASTFNPEARLAREQIESSGLASEPIYGPGGIAQDCHNAFRFKRIYVDKEFGVPFISSSEINSLRPRVEKYLSKKLTDKLEKLLIRKNDVLVSCSGTIGNVGLAGRRLEGLALSQHSIRVRVQDPEVAGYLAAFLRGRYGRLQLRSSVYGSVVDHIEPLHLQNVCVPRFGKRKEREMGNAFLCAVAKRDDANDLIDVAIQRVIAGVGLPPFANLSVRAAKKDRNTIRLSQIADRFEGAYHNAIAYAAEAELGTLSCGATSLSDIGLVREIRPITKFRKRTFVERGGIPLFSSKQLFQVDPVNIKRLAKGAHTKDLDEIALEENMIILTRSGTIGRVNIIPRYMEGWAGSEHATRIIASNDLSAGYIFAWLASDYGQCLVRRHSYGSVILEIDKDMIEAVPIPKATDSLISDVGGQVLEANKLRDEAWKMEIKVVREIESTIQHLAHTNVTSQSQNAEARR